MSPLHFGGSSAEDCLYKCVFLKALSLFAFLPSVNLEKAMGTAVNM